MRKSLLLVAAGLMFGLGANAQTVLSNETFTGGLNGWTVENLSATSPVVWVQADLNGAGVGEDQLTTGDSGSIYCLGHNSQQPHAGHSTITSPAISTTGSSVVFLQFEHIFNAANGNLNGTVYVSNDNSTWTSVYNTTTASGPGLTVVDVSATGADQATVYIRFELISEFDNYWIVDDVKLIVPPALDVKANTLVLESFAPMTSGAGEVSVTNLGADAVTSLEFTVTAGGAAPSVATASGLSIAPGETTVISLPNPFIPTTSGGYDVSVEISKVNGAVDNDPSNNTVSGSAIFYDPTNVAVRTPLYEVYTSSTCAPCTPGNANMHAILDPKDQSTFNYIKFQQNFPGAGDPYVTDEAVARRGYYGINSIPRMEIDGGWDGNANSFTEALHTEAIAVPAVANLTATAAADVNGQAVSYEVTVSPLINMPADAINVYVAIIENHTTANKGNNGETEFLNVMKKMVKGVNGEAMAAWTPGTDIVVSGSYVFPGDYRLPAGAANAIDINSEHTVEEFTDLSVITWVTFEDSKQVLQSEKAAATSSISNLVAPVVHELVTFPNPATDLVNVSFNLNGNASFTIELTDITGKVIDSRNAISYGGSVTTEFNVSDLASGNYLVNVLDNGKVIATAKSVVRH